MEEKKSFMEKARESFDQKRSKVVTFAKEKAWPATRKFAKGAALVAAGFVANEAWHRWRSVSEEYNLMGDDDLEEEQLDQEIANLISETETETTTD